MENINDKIENFLLRTTGFCNGQDVEEFKEIVKILIKDEIK